MYQVPQHQQHTDFNAQAPKYMCLCNHVHVKTGTSILCGILTANVVLQFVTTILSIVRGQAVVGPLIGLLINVILLFTLFQGIRKEQAKFLLPTLIAQAIYIVIVGLLTFVMLGAVFMDADYLEEICKKRESVTECDNLVRMRGALFVVMAVVLFLQTWAATIIVGCYRYFKEKAGYEASLLDAEYH